MKRILPFFVIVFIYVFINFVIDKLMFNYFIYNKVDI